MKTKLMLLTIIILSAATFALSQNKMFDSKTEQDLINSEKMAWKNLVDKKTDDFAKFLADDYQGIYDIGLYTKADELAEIKQTIFKSAEVSDVKVKMVNSGTALVTAIVKMEVIIPGGQEVSDNVRTTSIIVKRGKQWLCIYHSHVSIKTMS